MSAGLELVVYLRLLDIHCRAFPNESRFFFAFKSCDSYG